MFGLVLLNGYKGEDDFLEEPSKLTKEMVHIDGASSSQARARMVSA